MATRAEQFAEQQRKRAAEIRQSALNGTLSKSSTPTQTMTSRADAFRQHALSFQTTPMNELKAQLPPQITATNPLQSSTLMRAIQGDTQAQDTYKAATGISITPKPLSQYEIEQSNIDNSDWPAPVKWTATAGNWVTRGNPVGKFLSRATTVPGISVDPVDSTGSPLADKAAGLLGNYVAPVLMPSGAPLGGGAIGAPFQAAEKLVATNAGQKAVNTLANTIPKVSQPTAQAIAKGAITEGIAGVAQAPAGMLMMGESDAGDLLKGAAIGGVGGALLGGAFGAVGSAIGRYRNSRTLPIESPIERPIQTTAPKDISEFPVQPSRQPNDVMERIMRGADLEDQIKQPEIKIDPNADPILRPGQFDDQTGLGISAFGKRKAYDSLSKDTRSQLVSRIDREPTTLKGVTDRFYTSIVDDLHPLNKFDKLTEDVLGQALKDSDSPYKLALGSRGSDVISKQIVTDQLVDSSGNAVGKSLKEIMSKMPKNAGKHGYVDFEDYLLNKHAITRAERGEKVFRDELEWTPEKGAQKVAEFEQMFPEFKTMSDELYEFNKNMVNHWLVDTGMITREQAQAWFEANPYYVPNKRHFTELEKGNMGIGGKSKKGFGNQSVPVKKYGKGGSQRKIISPIESTIENVDAYVKTAKRNQVMQQLVRNIEQDPDAFSAFAEIVKKSDSSDILKQMSEEGIDAVLESLETGFNKANVKLDKDNIVRVLIGGEPVHVKINDKHLLEAITALGPENSGAVMNAIGRLTNTMKVLTTGNNPIFTFTRSLIRDIPQAYIASKTTNNPISFAMDLISATVDIAMKRGAYKEFLAVGGGHSSNIAANRNLLKKSKDTIVPVSGNPLAGVSLLNKNKGVHKAGIVPRLYRQYENIMNATETVPRLAEFKRTAADSGDLVKALYAAQDVTTNFKRHGTLTRELDKIFPYFNAAIQGLDQVIRVYKDNPAQAFSKSLLALSLPSLVLYAVNHDDPNYQKLNNRTKDAFFLIPKGDGTFIKLAKPQEQGTIFADLPERLMRLMQEEAPEAFRDFADRLRTTFLPPMLSGAAKEGNLIDRGLGIMGDTIIGPIADVAANKNFADAPIVPGYLQNLSPELQYDAKTTNVAKWIGETTKTSPKQIDYLLRQYSGVLGQVGQPLLSPGGDIGSTLNQLMTADPVFSNDISTEFYKYKEKLDQAYTDRDLKELPTWYDDRVRKAMGKISSNMSSVRKEIRSVQGDKSLSNDEKRQKLRELQDQINQMAEEGNALARGKVPY